ncbi:hypothetical protein PUN28_013856 [Cardiocondyla obscurior]|uniref:Uncharacterized protein n=1 Tax=Cardiocondyla obscurior TaxID=286306 RepID=A0AAW2F8M7_9HYME
MILSSSITSSIVRPRRRSYASISELPCAVNRLKRPPRVHRTPSTIPEVPAALNQLRRPQPKKGKKKNERSYLRYVEKLTREMLVN